MATKFTHIDIIGILSYNSFMNEILDESKKQRRELLITLANDLGDSLVTSSPVPTDILKDQAKILHYIMMQLVAEASPRGEKYSMQHSERRISLALRAQNQYCRTVLATDYLDDKVKNGNKVNKT